MSEEEAKLKSAWVDAPGEIKRYIGDLDAEVESLKAQLAARQDLINADLLLLNNQRERIDEMEKKFAAAEETIKVYETKGFETVHLLGEALTSTQAGLAAKEQECDRLKAELEKRKLKWQKGAVPVEGLYWRRWVTDPQAEPWSSEYCPRDGDLRGEWAGPIDPPEPAPDKG